MPTFFVNPKKRLIQKLAKEIADRNDYTSPSLLTPNVSDDVMQLVNTALKKDMFEITGTVEGEAHYLLAVSSFSLLSSGNYHIYYGQLLPAGKSLLRLFESSIDLAVKNNRITQQEADEAKSVLKENIATVG